jgi:hypothetical protein
MVGSNSLLFPTALYFLRVAELDRCVYVRTSVLGGFRSSLSPFRAKYIHTVLVSIPHEEAEAKNVGWCFSVRVFTWSLRGAKSEESSLTHSAPRL